MRAPRTRWLEPVGGQGEQFRDGLQVPVGRLRVDVSEPGRQHRQPGLDITAVAVEVQQGGDGEAVPQIVQSWAASPGAARSRPSSRRPAKVRVRLWTSRRVPRVETKKLGALRVRGTTGRGGGGSSRSAATVEWCRNSRRDLPNFESRINQRRGVEIDVVVVESARLGLAHPGDREQPDQRLPGRRPQRRASTGRRRR